MPFTVLYTTSPVEYKVYAEITATFRYGRDDLDVLGINFKKDLYTVRFSCMFTWYA